MRARNLKQNGLGLPPKLLISFNSAANEIDSLIDASVRAEDDDFERVQVDAEKAVESFLVKATDWHSGLWEKFAPEISGFDDEKLS